MLPRPDAHPYLAMDIDTLSLFGHNFAAIQLSPLARCMGVFYLHAVMRLFLSYRKHSKEVLRLLNRLFELRRLWDAFWTVL